MKWFVSPYNSKEENRRIYRRQIIGVWILGSVLFLLIGAQAVLLILGY